MTDNPSEKKRADKKPAKEKLAATPCQQNKQLRKQIERYAVVLKEQGHKLGDHGLSEGEFYASGLFRGAIEKIRGEFSATMTEKRSFVRYVLNHMQDKGHIRDWQSAGESNRHDYSITLKSGKTAVIELKGCLDGNNTNIFERPPHAEEFIIWSVCTNPGADPRHNAWSGIHTRLSAEIISRSQRVDGLIIWDMACGTIGRPCPKLGIDPDAIIILGPYKLPPPCLYLFPATIPAPRNNPSPKPQAIEDVHLLKAFRDCFGTRDDDINQVTISTAYKGVEITRSTTIERGGIVQQSSGATAIKRT